MEEIDLQETDDSGLEVVYTDAHVDGNFVKALSGGKGVLLHLRNDSASEVTVTIASPVPCNQGFNHDREVVLSADEKSFVGPFPLRFVDGDKNISWTYSDITDVSVAAIVIPA